ncbi:hypothetical protein I4U23_011309 [Adineta vaga]|nr:hypothetical protein I4U23_011309 [Adineta vaga]
MYYQQQLTNEMTYKINDIISSITSSLNIHLHLNQSLIINTSSVLFTLEKFSSGLNNKYQMNFSSNSIILIQTLIQPLASFGNNFSYTNLS